jgi:hypothetical protein
MVVELIVVGRHWKLSGGRRQLGRLRGHTLGRVDDWQRVRGPGGLSLLVVGTVGQTSGDNRRVLRRVVV